MPISRLDQFRLDAIEAASASVSPEQARLGGAAFARKTAGDLREARHGASTVCLDHEEVLANLLPSLPPESMLAGFFDAAYATFKAEGSQRPSERAT